MGKKSGSGSEIRIRDEQPGSYFRIRDEQPGSYFRELRNHVLGLKYFISLMRIRDPGWKKFESGIRDKHPGSAALHDFPLAMKKL
jgi:hypothetical protein